MKVLITGASGLLGRAVHQQCIDKGYDTRALAFSRADPEKQLVKLDLTDAAAVESCLHEFQPDVIVHTAAERRPDVVEKDPAASHAINVDTPASIATIASQLDKVPLLINISTDYVFDGSKPPYKVDDAPNPLNAYGVSKLQGERAVQEHAKPGHFTNLRVPVLYGKAITNNESAVNVLLDAIQPPAGSNEAKKCDAYAVRYPTNVADVAKAILKLAQVYTDTSNPVPPTTHFSAKEAMTKYDMCMVLSRIANSVGFETRTDHLDPEYEVDPMAATARPRHCKLDTSVLEAYGVPVDYTSFEDWWRPYLAELHKVKLEEEARLAAEAEAKRKKEEEERQQREAEEEAERQRKLERERRIAAEQAEAKAKAAAEAQRRAEEQAERQKEADEGATAAETERASGRPDAPPSSEAGEAPNGTDHDPGSPHPSFNSLQARPTPPATSGLPSPTSSHPPSSIKSGHRPDTPPPAGTRDALLSSAQSSVVIATTDATPTGSVVDDSPLNLAAARERQRLGSTLPQRSLSASSAARLTSLTDESTIFGGTARKSSLSGPAYLDTGSAVLSRNAGSDSDDDGYGQPSPRKDQLVFPERGQQGSPTPAGRSFAVSNAALAGAQTGSVASLGSSAPSHVSAEGEHSTPHSDDVAVAAAPTTQPRLYHRPSFDQLQDARDREAYERLHRRNWTFTIKVGDPQRIGDPMTAHIVYTVRVQTNCPAFRSQHFSSLRRYRDFRWLHAALVQNNPGIIVPPVPEKVSIGRFAAELVEARRIGLETCINKIANHPLLQQDDDLRLFLESDNFTADVKQRDLVKGPIVTPEQKTYKSWGSALLGSVVPSTSSLSSGALSAYSFEETDEWFNEQRVYLDSLENALKGMVKSVSALSNQRKYMVQATHDLAQVLTTLSGSSLSRSLSTCFAGLAEVKRRAMELEDLQAEADVRQLGTTMYEYERVVGSVRKAFKVRTEVWAKSARHTDELRKARARFDKYKSANPSSAGPQFQSLLAEVTEAETKALDAQRLFDTVSHRCKDEMERLDLERVLDFKRVVGEWLTDMIVRQEEVVEEWVRYCELLGRQTGVQILPAAAAVQGAAGEEGDVQQQQQQQQGQQQPQQPALSRSQSHASSVAVADAVQVADQGERAKSASQNGEISLALAEDASAATAADANEDAPQAANVPREASSQPAVDVSAGATEGKAEEDTAAAAEPTTASAPVEEDTSVVADEGAAAAEDPGSDAVQTVDAKEDEQQTT
ncbi:hypothetical protein EX895_003048 [Sporisorium graminicola]|uniref:PX domain-containing protein n=1 Tax=Sporisorium graminicola TaxID=280036 RepID=A0A4U7KYM1_9BASI|nr:hypothetical protein EX895_003048 [Sporisorium graminicola]TKY87952.1 hypothetical protein EX895_003048 [Sporisorium graminicola]